MPEKKAHWQRFVAQALMFRAALAMTAMTAPGAMLLDFFSLLRALEQNRQF